MDALTAVNLVDGVIVYTLPQLIEAGTPKWEQSRPSVTRTLYVTMICNLIAEVYKRGTKDDAEFLTKNRLELIALLESCVAVIIDSSDDRAVIIDSPHDHRRQHDKNMLDTATDRKTEAIRLYLGGLEPLNRSQTELY
jgi:hypothetical protein